MRRIVLRLVAQWTVSCTIVIVSGEHCYHSLRTERNIKFAYPIGQSRPLHSQACGRAIRTTDHPVGCPDCPQHVLALHFFHGGQLLAGRLRRSLLQFRKRWMQHTARRENDRRSIKFCSSRTLPGHE